MDYAAWLKDPAAIRIVLIEVGVKVAGLETTRYLSTRPYVTSPTDSPANQFYEPIISTSSIKFTESLSLDGQGSLSIGDIEILNQTGQRDNWLDDIWDNHPIKAWIGDPRWKRSDFQMIFNGVVATIGSKSRDMLNLSMRDKLQYLNTPVTDKKIGGTGPNKDDVISLTFGEAHNVTPQLTDAARLEYQIHDGPVEGIFEVRDNGIPVNVSVDSNTGRFLLSRSPAGAITASVQGDKVGGIYSNTISALVQRIVTSYGQADSRFTADDLDLANLAAFDATYRQPVGVYADGRTNVLKLCQDLAGSVGAQLIMSRLGKLRLIQLQLPGAGTPVPIGPEQMVERSLVIKSRPLVQAAVMLGFNKNWTVQEGLLTSIPAEHKNLYATEWLTATATSTDVQHDYKLNAAPVQVDSMLLCRTDAQPEAQRRLNIWSTPRTVFEFEGTSDLLASLEIGTAVTLTNRRFGLKNGKNGVVVSLTPNWLNGHVTVGVLV